jgi:hypothetical protein
MILRCTKKLIKIYNLPILEDITSNDNIFSEWYANLIYIEGKKCILFTEIKTLYSIILLNIKKSDIKNIGEIFYKQLYRSLYQIGIKEELIIKNISKPIEIKYTKTHNKRILGSMNDYAYQYKYIILANGGIRNTDIDDMIHNVNESPMSLIGYNSADRLVRMMILKENFA